LRSGLRVGADEARAICCDGLASGGDIFVAAVLASDDLAALAHILDRIDDEPQLARGFVSALGWLEADDVLDVLERLLAPTCSPALQALGIAGALAHRRDPGIALMDALASRDDALRARALRAAGELGRKDLLPEVLDAFAASSDEVRFWSARSALLLGEERACSLAVRCSERERAHAELRALLDSFERTAIVGIGALGDPTMLPALMESMREPALVQLAREAFTLITGLELEAEDGPDVVEAAIEGNAKEWNDASRLLLGRRPNARRCVWLLHDGLQRHRAAAAIELKLLQPDKPLFETRAPVSRQRRALVRAHSWQVP